MPIRLTPTVKILLIINFAVFIIQQTGDQFLGTDFLGIFGLIPGAVVNGGYLWQLATYSFLHGDVMHLLLNLLMLFFIGGELEGTWGRKRFLSFYFFCVVFAGIVYLLMQIFVHGGLGVPMVGASGGIYGLLLAYGILFGERTLLFMLLFPMKAKYFIWILAGVEFMTSLYSRHGGLSAIAHLAGMAAGLIYLFVLTKLRISKKSGSSLFGSMFQKKKKKKKSHLKLVVNEIDSDESDDEGPKTWH